MLGGIVRRLFGSRKPTEGAKERLLEAARESRRRGDLQGTIKALRAYLEVDPQNVPVLNDLGTYLVDTGNLDEAAKIFELGYSLDDTFLPGMVNRAKVFADQRRSADAMPYLVRAKIAGPQSMFPETIFASICMARGEISRALAFQLRAWMSDFDSLRLANGYLFWVGYEDMPEQAIAAEHRFWAETLSPLPDESEVVQANPAHPRKQGGRIRIGYWSPDFRSHSVRFFANPVIQSHDRERFEVFAYHDFPGRDSYTERVRSSVDHFHDVHEMPDGDLASLLRSHDLDVLVELAGHTSYNRLHMLQNRFARLQLTAFGYPPTTGLTQIDAKVLDASVVTPAADRYYTEQPLALPTSFWCFDPMEDVPIATEPPFVRNGYVTFGCAGNISKITAAALRAWKRILTAISDSRLVIRSISFMDEEAVKVMRARLEELGLPLDRVELSGPQVGAAFFSSYDEIDIVLDTFPFNGGTTTCFATYMGVPVVSRAGESLISRMGLSVMTTLGAPDLALTDWDKYVERAIDLAADAEFLRRFKAEARDRYRGSALGNGKKFVGEFEAAIVQWLREPKSQVGAYRSAVAPLPADELARRAYAVTRYGNVEAAGRIVRHCLSIYPENGAAHVLAAQLHAAGGELDLARDYLSQRLDTISPSDKVPALLMLVRLELLLEHMDAAAGWLERLGALTITDDFDRAQFLLYQSAITPAIFADRAGSTRLGGQRFHVVVPCDDLQLYESLRSRFISQVISHERASVSFERCDEALRIETYNRALAAGSNAIVVFIQKNVEICSPDFLVHVASALETSDIVGFAGALRWERMDWRLDDMRMKVGSFITPSSEREGYFGLHVLGLSQEKQVGGMAILDGTVLAIRPGLSALPVFDEELLGCETLIEEYWIYQCGNEGVRLGVRRDLGVYLNGVPLPNGNRTEARVHCANQLGFDPFVLVNDDAAALSVPLRSVQHAVQVSRQYLGQSE